MFAVNSIKINEIAIYSKWDTFLQEKGISAIFNINITPINESPINESKELALIAAIYGHAVLQNLDRRSKWFLSNDKEKTLNDLKNTMQSVENRVDCVYDYPEKIQAQIEFMEFSAKLAMETWDLGKEPSIKDPWSQLKYLLEKNVFSSAETRKDIECRINLFNYSVEQASQSVLSFSNNGIISSHNETEGMELKLMNRR